MFVEREIATPVSRPGEPTDALPGSEEKIQVLTERATRSEPLFHPLDRRGKKLPSTSAFPAEAG